MINDPGNHLKVHAQKLFPGEDARGMTIVEIGASAHVDMAVSSVCEGLVVRLMLPHTAPVDAKPLITHVWLGDCELWDFRKDSIAAEYGASVFLHRDKEGYVLLYLAPDEQKTERLDHIVMLQEMLGTKSALGGNERLLRREKLARSLGHNIYLSGSQHAQVRRHRQSERDKAKKKSQK